MGDTQQLADQSSDDRDRWQKHFDRPEVQARISQFVTDALMRELEGLRDLNARSIDGIIADAVQWFRRNAFRILIIGGGVVATGWVAYRVIRYRFPDRDVGGHDRSPGSRIASAAENMRRAVDAVMAMGYRATEARRIVRALRDSVDYTAGPDAPANVLPGVGTIFGDRHDA